MPKHSRRRSHSRHSKKHNISAKARTFQGLMKWRNHQFEHLGWMVLAKERGYMDKVVSYKKTLERLKDSIKYKIDNIYDEDKKNDLMILLNDTEILCKYANRLL